MRRYAANLMTNLTRAASTIRQVKSGISTAHFTISNWCNAKCVFCSYPSQDQRITVSLENAKKAIDALRNLGVGIVALTGGEPFLNADIFDIAEYATSKGMSCYTGTNRSLMTRDAAYKLRDAGIRSIWISYEAPSEEIFERNKGIPGLAKKIRMGLDHLREAGVDVYAISVINKSIENYKDFIDHLIHLGFDAANFDYPMTALESTYRGYSDWPGLKYTGEEMRHAIEQIKELKRTKYRNFSIKNPTAGLNGIVDFYSGAETRFPCFAGFKIFYLDWNLDLFPCPVLPQKLGKVWDVQQEDLSLIECNRCYYQGCRDYDSLYYLLYSLGEAKRIGLDGNWIDALRTLVHSNNLVGLKSFFESG